MPGTGSVYRRKSDGRWTAQISLGSRSDRRILRCYAPKRDNTRDQAKELLEELRAGLDAPRGRSMTLGSFLRSWLDDSARPSIRPNTYRGYDVIVRTHLAPLAGIPLRELAPEDIEAVLNRMSAAPKTIRNAQVMLRRALRVAEERGYVARNVARFVPLRRVPRRLVEPLTAERARAIRAAMADDRYAAALDLALVGLREGEILGLAWDDVDLERGIAHVRYELVRREGRYFRDDVKSDASAAPVPLPAFAVASLRVHEARQREERIAAGRPTERGLVFVTPRGRPVNGDWFTKHFQRRLAEAGLPRMRLHDLRHGTASLLAAAGVHPKVAQAYLRHAQSSTTMDVYTHVGAGQQRDAADELERAIAES